MATNREKYLTISYIFMVIECALFGFLAILLSILSFTAGITLGNKLMGDLGGILFLVFFLVPLLWLIPITVMTKRARNRAGSTLVLGICTLLFANIVSGIFTILADTVAKTVPEQKPMQHASSDITE